MASRPAVEPALVTRAQRALCTILVAATLAACSPSIGPRPTAPGQQQWAPLIPDPTLGYGGGNTMGFYLPTCTRGDTTRCLQVVFAIGEITPRTPDDFATFLRLAAPYLPNGFRRGQWAVILDSGGGNVTAALTLGTQFRQMGWNTIVGLPYAGAGLDSHFSVCASACIYLFAGGAQRWVFQDNVLAIHQFSDGDHQHMNVAQAQYLSGVIGAYLFRMGVSANLQTLASLTLPGQWTTLTIQDALALGLANRR